MNKREFIENIKNYSVFEHMREGFIVPKETYLRLVEIADESEQQNKRYQQAFKEVIEYTHERECCNGELYNVRLLLAKAIRSE